MINLITGTPGSGKTSYALQFLLEQLKGSKRKIYVHGIPELKIPHEQVYCSSKTCDICQPILAEFDIDPSLMAENWHLYAPEGAVYFFDEVQNIYRPRASSAKVPDSVASFEVHRHKGLDFFLITQNPKLLDTNIRSLVSRHIHLKPTWVGRFQYEWPECKDSVQSTTDAIKSTYKLDKNTFSLYKSASIHTKQKRKIPTILYFLIVMLIILVFLSQSIYARKLSNQEQIKADIQLGSGVVVEPDASGNTDTTVPLDLSIEQKPKYLDYVELAVQSYNGFVDPVELDPNQCFIYSKKNYKCYVPQHLVARFQQSYCNGSLCFAFIRYQVANDKKHLHALL